MMPDLTTISNPAHKTKYGTRVHTSRREGQRTFIRVTRELSSG